MRMVFTHGFSDLSLGDSISVSGACLTLVAFDAETFTVQVSPETLLLTTLGEAKPGKMVNLERALPAGARLGGAEGHLPRQPHQRFLDRHHEPDGAPSRHRRGGGAVHQLPVVVAVDARHEFLIHPHRKGGAMSVRDLLLAVLIVLVILLIAGVL